LTGSIADNRLDFEFAETPGPRRVTLPRGPLVPTDYLLAGLLDPAAASVTIDCSSATIHLGTTNEAKEVYGNFTNIASLRFLLNGSSASDFPPSIAFQGRVQTGASFSLVAPENWTGKVTIESLVVSTALPEPSCSPWVLGGAACKWTAEPKTVRLSAGQNFDQYLRWTFDDIQIGADCRLTWDVRSFSGNHLRFSIGSTVVFSHDLSGPTPSAVPVVPPPPTISGEFDLSKLTRDTGFTTIVRRHNGSTMYLLGVFT
jgi:hypothetical protein